MNKKKRSIVSVVLITVIILCVIGIAKPRNKKDNSSQKETTKVESIADIESIKNTEAEQYSKLEGVDIAFLDSVRDDQTGNWRLAKVTSNKSEEVYVLDYYKKYFKEDKEVHAIVNYTLNTTTCVTSIGNKINVRVYEHIKDEEQHAKTLFTGQKYAEYNVDKETGAVEKIE